MTEAPAIRTWPNEERPTVLKLGGETLRDQHATLEGVAAASRRHPLVIAHGGGKRLTGWLERLGIESHFEGGRRITDDRALEAAVAVLGGVVNTELVAALQALGVQAVGLSGVDGGLIAAERVLALGLVGRVVGARPRVVEAIVGAGFVPVVAPIALDEHGQICNVNADEVAAGLAAALGGRLVMLSDTDGVQGADGRRISRLDPSQAEALVERGVISGGMIPKVRGAIAVLAAGGTEVVIADGRGPESVERALDDPAYGTRLVRGEQ